MGKLIICKVCGKEYSDNADACPHCGDKPINWNEAMPKVMMLGLVLLVVIIAICSSQKSNRAVKAVEPNAVFEQVGYYKSGHYRVFSFYTTATDSMTFVAHGRRQMHSDDGITSVQYFSDQYMTPDVTLSGIDYNEKYDKYRVAVYTKNSRGQDWVVIE